MLMGKKKKADSASVVPLALVVLRPLVVAVPVNGSASESWQIFVSTFASKNKSMMTGIWLGR